MDLNAIISIVTKYAISPLLWLLILVIVAVGLFGILWLRKYRTLQFTGIELTEFGGLNTVKCGWFGMKWYAKGLWTTGRKVMMTDVGEIIEEFSEQDFREVNGKRGLLFYRDPINKRLFPLSKIRVENKELISRIPPAEYIDNALRIIDDVDRETEDKVSKITQMVIWGLMIVGGLIAIILVVQYSKHMQEEAGKLMLEAGKTCLESARSVCSTITSETIKGVPLTAP